MNKEFTPYEQALALKELGFDEPCFGWYENNELVTLLEYIYPEDRLEFIKVGEISKRISAPTFSQAFRWFRERHNIDGLLHKTAEGSYYFWITECEYENYNHYKYHNQIVYFKTYEEAELACLDKLLEIVETKSTQNTNDGRTMEKLIESNRKFDEKNNDNVKYDSSDRNEDMPNITNFFI